MVGFRAVTKAYHFEVLSPPFFMVLHGQAEVKFVVGVVVYAALLTITANRTSELSNVAFEQGFERDIALKNAQESHQRELALREQLAVQAQHDELTGMFNRRRMSQEPERQIMTRHRCNTIFSVMLIDLDHFKEINDTLDIRSGIRC